jgi:hypothetical protein
MRRRNLCVTESDGRSDGRYQPKPKIGRPNGRGGGPAKAARGSGSDGYRRTIFFLGLATALAAGAGAGATTISLAAGDAPTVEGARGAGFDAVAAISGAIEPRSWRSLGVTAGNAIVSGTNRTGGATASIAAVRAVLVGVRIGRVDDAGAATAEGVVAAV